MRAALIDISRWQGKMDLQQVADAGFMGVIARCTIGWSGLDWPSNARYLDAQRQARQIPGFIFGAYHLLWAGNRDPAREAAWYLQNRGLVDLNVLDVELDDRNKSGFPPLREVQAQAKVWLNEIANATGLQTICYTGSWWWNQVSGIGLEQEYDLWEAEYTHTQPVGGVDKSLQPEEPEKPKIIGWNEAKFWQWTSSGKPVGASSHSLDYNVFMGDEEDLRAYLNLGPPPLTDKEKLDLLWDHHPELHP